MANPTVIYRVSLSINRPVTLDATNTMEVYSSGRYLEVEMKSLSLFPDGIRFSVQVYPLDQNGNFIPVITQGALAAGGHFVNIGNRTFDGGANEFGLMWRIHVPAQQSVGAKDSNGVSLNVKYNSIK